MPHRCYDVFIIGGGPIGTYTAYQLADKGFDVCLAEKKSRIGDGVICAGVISKETFKRYDLPPDSILCRIDSFIFVSPSGQRLEYIHPDIFAYIVDREIFDRGLGNLAQRMGVHINLSTKIKRIEEEGKRYKIYSNQGDIHYAKSVVLATGVDYNLQIQVGMGKPDKFLHGAQIELPLSSDNSRIEIHLSQRFAPGSFGWIVPAGKNKVRVGLLVERYARRYLKKMLEERVDGSSALNLKKELKTKLIANRPIKRSVWGRVISVGEAAGQIKTTTGGGISFGLLCSEIAVDKIVKALKGKGSLEDYEVTWRSILQPEFDIGEEAREIANKLSDRALERLFSFVKKNRFWVKFLLPKINFDFHSDLLSFCLKSFRLVLKNY